MKIIGYLIFAVFYYLFRILCKVKPKKIFAVMTHDGSRDGNVGSLIEYLKLKKEGYSFQCIKKEDRNKAKNLSLFQGKISFFVVKPYHMATSEFILLDNIFLPMAYITFPKRVRVIQLWHGTGTIKKFGQDVNTGRLKKLEKRANQKVTHLIVNSEMTKKQYARAFGIEENKVFIYGLPRTDLFFNPELIAERKQKFYQQYPQLKGKKLILYAPTFRDQEKNHPNIALDMEQLCDELSEEYMFLLRLHPFVAAAQEKNGDIKSPRKKQILSMSDYEDINTLLLVSDYLITDYSSIIFEYCLLDKPMLFYAYDLEQFSGNGRGFYEPYKEYVPGPVIKDTKEMIEFIKEDRFDKNRMKEFVKKNYQYMDGKSAERIYMHIFRC